LAAGDGRVLKFHARIKKLKTLKLYLQNLPRNSKKGDNITTSLRKYHGKFECLIYAMFLIYKTRRSILKFHSTESVHLVVHILLILHFSDVVSNFKFYT